MPGIASCFTRICGSAKLCTMSLLERWTMTGRSIGRLSWLIVVMSSRPAGSRRSRPSGLDGPSSERHRKARREEEARPREPILSLQERSGLQRREGEEQQERRHELRPDEERETEPGHPRRAELHDRGDEVQRPEEGGKDQAHHPEEPPRLAIGRCEIGKRRVGGPVVRSTSWNEKACQHDGAAGEVEPVARQIETRKRHIRRANLEWDEVIAERAHGEWHHSEEHHDRPVHRPELVVELRKDYAAGCVGLAEQSTDVRNRLTGIGKLPANQDDQ